MYTPKHIGDGWYYLIDDNGQPLKGWDGKPNRMNKAVAELAAYQINNPVYDQPQPLRRQDVRGVMDNRHRNWRRRG